MAQVEPVATSGSRTVTVVLVVVIVAVGALFGYYYVQSSNKVSSLDKTISQKNALISTLNSTIASDTDQIADLMSTVNDLQARVSADEARIASLSAGYAGANATIALLNSEISSLNEQISSLNSEIQSLNNQISLNQAQILGLQAQVAQLQGITGLALFTQEAGPKSYSTTGTGSVVNFTADYAGYVVVTMSAASDFANEGVVVFNSFGTAVHSPFYSAYSIGFLFSRSPDALVFPVAPGTVRVYLITLDSTAQSATLTVTYYY